MNYLSKFINEHQEKITDQNNIEKFIEDIRNILKKRIILLGGGLTEERF